MINSLNTKPLRFILLCGTCLLCSAQVFGQSDSYYMNIIPPSPEASALAKYGEIPVGTYTGIPNINVPIYDIQSKNLGMDVSLSYHAGGIKVGEEASRVGLGWSLNAGGVVTRVVRGVADDLNVGWFNASPTVLELEQMGADNIKQEDLLEITQGTLDVEADIYHFNFNGRSGKFFFDQSGNYYISPHQNLVIETLRTEPTEVNLITGWIFTDEEGDRYYFGVSEDNIRKSRDKADAEQNCVEGTGGESDGGSGPTSNISTWHLLSVRDMNSTDQIELFYSSYNLMGQCSRTGETKYLLETNSAGCPQKPISRCRQQITAFHGKKLDRITFDKGEVRFIYNDSRQDLNGDYELDEIQIHSSRTSGSLEKSFALHHSYLTSSSYNANWYCDPVGQEFGRYRLKLDRLEEKSASESLHSYYFDYNSLSLPEKGSYAQDTYGYYNGKTNNETLIPTGDGFIGADRQLNPTFTQASMLKSITYPTGGKTVFYYEPNKSNSTNLQKITRRVYSDGLYPKAATDFYETTFKIKNGPIVDLQSGIASVNAFVELNAPCANLDDDACGYEFRLQGITDPTFGIAFNHTGTEHFVLNEGFYHLSLIVNSHNFDDQVSLRVSWDEEVPQLAGRRSSGGIRVKKIESFDGINTKPSLVKSYKYHEEDNPLISSGRIVGY
ncbi:MAG: hypothetical protein ABJG78_20960, partial [Cyclobacteriaceae bacterium]